MNRPGRRFLFDLAGHLGMTVAELSSRMDAVELREWADYFDARGKGEQQSGGLESLLAIAVPK